MKVSDAMHKSVEWVDAETPISDIAVCMEKNDIGAVPVGKADRLIGMVTDRDIALRVVARGKDPKRTTAEQIMTPKVVYSTTQSTVADAVHLMDQKKLRRLPVLDGNKRLVGMLSLGDVAHSAGLEMTGELTRAVAAHHS